LERSALASEETEMSTERATAAELLRERLEKGASSHPFRSYRIVRERVLEMLDHAEHDSARDSRPSEYWHDELASLEYMLDASPLVIERLRHHCYHVTGIWPYSYRAHRDRSAQQHAAKLSALLEVGDPTLFVPESPLLGGFGFELEHGLANVDTLKFFEVLLALDAAEILQKFRDGAERRLVWEIGAGWGGFAYAFKTLFPDTTYVISDLPQLFLYSATYLMSAFPGATFTFHTSVDEPITEDEWSRSDFVFVPAHALDAVRPPSTDLAVNMISFQEMTTEQVEQYVRHAHDLEVPFLYSLNRERSNYNPELRGVTAILEKLYWLHEVDILPVSYQVFPDRVPVPTRGDKKRRQQGESSPRRDDNNYHHIVGWRRLVI
jgi:hypothetical protein